MRPNVGVFGDRRYAIPVKGRTIEGWAGKTNFHVCMNRPRMAMQKPRFDGRKLDPIWVHELGPMLDDPDPGIFDTKGAFNMVDTNPTKYGPTVSFLNLASVQDLEPGPRAADRLEDRSTAFPDERLVRQRRSVVRARLGS